MIIIVIVIVTINMIMMMIIATCIYFDVSKELLLAASTTSISWTFLDELGDSLGSFDIDDSHAYNWPALDQLSHRDDTTSLSGNSLSPSSSIIQTFYEDKEKDVRIGINHFNRSV